MTFANKLKYAGASPFAPEHDRADDPDDDLTHAELELLEQDKTYKRLAQVRYLADELESEVAGVSDIPEETRAHLFRTVAADDAPLTDAVDHYVEAWLAEHRTDDKTGDNDSGREEPTRSEPADFGHGESTGVQDL